MLSRETSWIQKKCQYNTMKTSYVGRGRVVCEFASKIAQKRASETGPLQFVLCWLTGGRLSVDCRSSVGRVSVECRWSSSVRPTVGRQSVYIFNRASVERRSSIGRASADARPTLDRRSTDIGRASVDARPTHDRRSTDASVVRRPTAHRCHLYDTWSVFDKDKLSNAWPSWMTHPSEKILPLSARRDPLSLRWKSINSRYCAVCLCKAQHVEGLRTGSRGRAHHRKWPALLVLCLADFESYFLLLTGFLPRSWAKNRKASKCDALVLFCVGHSKLTTK